MKSNSIDKIFSRIKATGILKKVPLFHGMFNDEFDLLFDICLIHRVGPNKVIFSEGDPSESLYVVLSGKLAVFTKQNGMIHMMEQGELLGEMGIVLQISRTATAKSLDEVVILLEIRKKDFDFILGKKPRVSFIIMKNLAKSLAKRLIKANK